MILRITRGFVAFLSFFVMVFGQIIGANNWDTIKKYEDAVNSVSIYENTMETAVPQTEVYNIIKDHFNSSLPQGKTVKKAIVLGYDGCRADTFSLLDANEKSAIKTLVNDGGHAVIAYCGGVNYPKFNKQKTSTAPGWCSMLTGNWADVHGVTDNDIPKSNDHLTLLTTLVEDGTIDKSAFYVSWPGHFSTPKATYINEKQYIEDKGLNVNFVCSDTEDNGTYELVTNDIKAENCSDFIFSIFEYCDHAGHTTGFNLENKNYSNGFKTNDEICYDIIAQIKARPTYQTEDWLIILTSDHGGFNLLHGSFTIQERYTFIVTNKDFDF